jgi:protein-tyrosine phosphatase
VSDELPTVLRFAGPLQILVVCTANVCRSPLAADVIADACARDLTEGIQVSVSSAGAAVDADGAMVVCAQSASMTASGLSEHRVRSVSVDDLSSSSIVLTLDGTQRAEVARMLPGCRPRLFTLVQAALLAEHVGRQLDLGQLPEGALRPPRDPRARIGWLLTEMDAARGALAGMGEGALDIEDRHAEDAHHETLLRVRDSAATLAWWIARVALSSRSAEVV